MIDMDCITAGIATSERDAFLTAMADMYQTISHQKEVINNMGRKILRLEKEIHDGMECDDIT